VKATDRCKSKEVTAKMAGRYRESTAGIGTWLLYANSAKYEFLPQLYLH